MQIINMKNKLLVICFVFALQYAGGQTTKTDTPIKWPEPEMVTVDGGTFMMRAVSDSGMRVDLRGTPYQVTLSSYKIAKYEVTQAEWQLAMGTNVSLHQGCTNCPVEDVSWNDIQLFINTLNEKTGRHYQLPTEAQWEFAARGGNKSKQYKYAGSNYIDEVAWTGGEWVDQTHPVGRKKSNELGIYDMSGNVAEWCSDIFDPYYSPGTQTNPRGPSTGFGHVIRGGHWGNPPLQCQVTSNGMAYADERNAHIGFRLALAF